MRYFRAFAAAFLAGVVLVQANAGELKLPAGWRLPTQAELAEDSVRNDSPTKFATAFADLNGDGIEDQAYILMSTKFSGEALWVYQSDGKSDFSWIKLGEIKWGNEYSNVPPAMGIAIVKPGVVAYACFDEAKDCDFGDRASRPKLKLRDPALLYFKLESAASMYFWSKSQNRFLKVWLSD